MSAGISSSLNGEQFKVLYVLQFQVVHQGHKPAVTVSFPVMVMTPDSSIIKSKKTRKNDHPNWDNNTYKFSDKKYFLTPEDEAQYPYLVTR